MSHFDVVLFILFFKLFFLTIDLQKSSYSAKKDEKLNEMKRKNKELAEIAEKMATKAKDLHQKNVKVSWFYFVDYFVFFCVIIMKQTKC